MVIDEENINTSNTWMVIDEENINTSNMDGY